jgi:APA family basic amino acid/polyamine antiporter
MAAPPPSALARRLGPGDAAAIVVSNVIGSGILITPAFIAATAPSATAMLGVWLAGGLLAFAGAMAYAELAALRPRAGGEYVYLYDAFGPLAAFLTGWTSFVAGFSGAIAASAVGLASYLGRFVPGAGDTTPLLTIPLGVLSLTVSPQAIVALAAIAALSWVHIRGVGPGRLVQNTFAIVKVLVLLGFVALALGAGTGSAGHFAAGRPATTAGLLLAMIPVMFSYSGWNAAAYVAEEIRNPGRNVPLALGLGTGAVVLVYLALNVAYIYAMPVPELAGLQVRVIDAAADRLFGANAGDALALVTILIVAGSISAMVFAGPRVYYAMARDGLFLPAAARVSPRFGTPAFSIAAQGVWSGHVRAARRLHGLRRRPLCGGGRERAVRPAAPPSRRRPPVPGLGLPGRAGPLRGGKRRARGQRGVAQPGSLGGRPSHHRGGHSNLRDLPAAIGGAVTRGGAGRAPPGRAAAGAPPGQRRRHDIPAPPPDSGAPPTTAATRPRARPRPPAGPACRGSPDPGHEENRERSQAREMIRHAAEEDLPEEPASLAAHDDERGAGQSRPLEDQFRRDPVCHLRVDL